MNALVYVDIDRGIHKGKLKNALNEKRKKLRGFSFSINMANFEAFRRTKKLISNFFFLKSDHRIDSALRVAGLSESACWAHCWAYPILGKKYFKILANKQKCVHWPLSPHFCSTFESLTNDIQSIVTKSTLSLSPCLKWNLGHKSPKYIVEHIDIIWNFL